MGKCSLDASRARPEECQGLCFGLAGAGPDKTTAEGAFDQPYEWPAARVSHRIVDLPVPADTPGVTQGGPYEKAGMAADKNGDLWFEDVRVPLEYRACGPGEDFRCFRESP